MKIPVGYKYKSVLSVEVGDVVFVEGEVVDIFDERGTFGEDENSLEADIVCLVFEDHSKNLYLVEYDDLDKVRTLRKAVLPKDDMYSRFPSRQKLLSRYVGWNNMLEDRE